MLDLDPDSVLESDFTSESFIEPKHLLRVLLGPSVKTADSLEPVRLGHWRAAGIKSDYRR